MKTEPMTANGLKAQYEIYCHEEALRQLDLKRAKEGLKRISVLRHDAHRRWQAKLKAGAK